MSPFASSANLTAMPRVTPRLASAFAGLLRLTWSRQWTMRNGVSLLALVAALGGLTYLTAANPNPRAWEDWIEHGFLTAIMPVLAFMAGAGAVREDLKPGAVDYIMTRPLSRWVYVLFKYISQATVALTIGALALGLMVGIGAVEQVAWLPVARLAITLVGGTLAFLGLGFAFGALTSRYMVFGLAYAGLVEAAVGNIPIQLNQLSILRHLRVILRGAGFDGGAGPVGSAGWLLVITLVLIAVAAGVFAMKEFVGEKGGDA